MGGRRGLWLLLLEEDFVLRAKGGEGLALRRGVVVLRSCGMEGRWRGRRCVDRVGSRVGLPLTGAPPLAAIVTRERGQGR